MQQYGIHIQTMRGSGHIPQVPISHHPPCGCAFEWGDPSEEIAYDNNSFNVRPLPPHFSGLSLSSSAFNQRSLYSTSMSSRSLSSSSVSPVPSKELRSLISWAFIQLEIYWTQWITFSFAHLSCLRDHRICIPMSSSSGGLLNDVIVSSCTCVVYTRECQLIL